MSQPTYVETFEDFEKRCKTDPEYLRNQLNQYSFLRPEYQEVVQRFKENLNDSSRTK